MKIKFHRFKLTHQFIAVFIIVVFIPLIIAGFLLVNINQHAVRKELYYSAKVTLDNVNYRLLSSVDIPYYYLKFLANLVVTSSQSLSQNEIRSFMEYMVYSVPQIKSIEVYSEENKSVLAFNPENLQTYNFLDFETDYYLFVNKKDDAQIITLYAKVPKNDFGYKIIKANLDNSIMQDVIFSNISAIDRYVRIINSQGYVVFAYPEEKTEIDTDDRFSVPENILKESKPGEVVRFGPFKNQPALFYKVPSSNLSIIIYTPQSVTYYGIIMAKKRILITLIFAALISVFLGLIYVRELNKNFRQLIKAVNAIEQGKYTRKVRLIKTLLTPYELVYLTNEFNAMAQKVHTTLKDLQDANDKLAELDKLKSNLIDTVSHELRTPLTSIRGYTSRLLRKDVQIPEDIREKSLRVIKEQSERLSRLVEDLLVIPDIETSVLRVYYDNVDILSVINKSILYFKSKKNERDIKVYYPENIPTIITDPDRLEQVMINLISNAIKYSYPDTPVSINIDLLDEENKLTIDVINDCEAISEKVLLTLFEKFKRLDDDMTRTTRGSGLGLFITKGIVEAIGGTINLKYTDKFIATVTLPLGNALSQSPILNDVNVEAGVEKN